jgi:hypothetical protein
MVRSRCGMSQNFSDGPRAIASAFKHFVHVPAFPFASITVAIAELRAGSISPASDLWT